MTAAETRGPSLEQLEEAVSQAASATKTAADKVAGLESQLASARSELETAKAHEMEVRRALTVAKAAQ